MALNLLDGIMGAGKTYVATNFFMVDELLNGNRHIYTNLPIKPDVIARHLSRGKPTRYREIIDRLHILENKESPVLDAEGKPLMVRESKKPDAPLVPLMLNEIRCFWRFTQPNSVIILDECADWFNARDWKSNAELGAEENELQSYVNHHRHYKDDLYIVCQNIDDIDKQIRTKFHHLYRVANSLKENMFEWKFLKGVKWPIQFFKVRVYHPRNLREPEETFTVWPRSAGFKRYDSFSASERIPGKALPPKESASSDYGQSYWRRMSLWLSRSWQLLMWAAGFLGGVGGVAWVVYGLIFLDSNTVAQVVTREGSAPVVVQPVKAESKPAPSAVGAVTAPAPVGNTVAQPAGNPVEVPKTPEPPKPPHVVLVATGMFKTSDGKWYRVGDDYEGKRILHFDTNAIYCADGVWHRTNL